MATRTLLILLLSSVASAAEPLDRHGDPLPVGAIARWGTLRFRPNLGEFGDINVVTSPDGKVLAVGEQSGVRFFNTADGRELGFAVLRGTFAERLTFSPDGKQLPAHYDLEGIISRGFHPHEQLHLIDVKKARVDFEPTIDSESRSAFGAHQFAAGGGRFIAVESGTVCVYATDSFKLLATFQGDHFLLCHDERELLIRAPESNVRVIHFESCQERRSFKFAAEHNEKWNLSGLSADGRRPVSRRRQLWSEELPHLEYRSSLLDSP